MAAKVLECLTKFNQLILLIVNFFVAVSLSNDYCVSVCVCKREMCVFQDSVYSSLHVYVWICSKWQVVNRELVVLCSSKHV